MIRLIIDIREELVTRWGGIFIEGFTKTIGDNLTFGHIGLPGFEYNLPEDKGEATFNFNMERIVNDAQKGKKENAGIHLLTDEKETKLPPIEGDSSTGDKPDGQNENPE